MPTKTYSVAAFAVAAQVFLSPIPEVSTIKVVAAYFIANCALLLWLLISPLQPFHFATVVIDFFSINFTFLSTAITLTVIRRLYFSPLSRFPGPKIAAISSLWEANEFRTGPNEVCVNNIEAIAKIYKGKYTRGTFYEIGAINGEFNLNTTRDYKNHTPWRGIWERAFVSGEFKDYNLRVEHHVSKLIDILKTKQKAGGNFTKLMDGLAFDIMADLVFSHDAGMQDGTGDGSYMDFIHSYMSVVAVSTPQDPLYEPKPHKNLRFAIIKAVGSLRNLSQLLPYMPESAEVATFRLNGENLLAHRQKLGISPRDLFRHLLAEDSETGCRFTQAQFNSNANLAIVAGSDTTSSSMTRAFRALAKDTRVLRKLQDEVDRLCEDGKQLTVETTKNLPYVNAVVSETVRLYNPVPSGIQAATAPGGVEIIDGVYLPGNCQVRVPHATIMTDERYFPKGEEFIPERWTGERPELILDRRAYIPFGYGAHSCVGKQLALNEMRLTLSNVVRHFDIALGDSYQEEEYLREWKDFMVVKLGALHLRFIARHFK